TLGAPLSISEEGAPQPVFRGKMVAGMAAAPTPIAQGEETLSISVSVSWAIKGQ
ncbi:MAG TPA: SIMPL domain-containing protein, partial [Roseiarcus sp.]